MADTPTPIPTDDLKTRAEALSRATEALPLDTPVWALLEAASWLMGIRDVSGQPTGSCTHDGIYAVQCRECGEEPRLLWQ